VFVMILLLYWLPDGRQYDAHFPQAEKEPILSSFLYASVLSHDCLE